MPHIDYPNVITENAEQLHELEKRYRYTHLFQRVRMLRLLKSGECANLGEAADALGYSRRQCQRWWGAYSEGALNELLVSRVDERGPKEFVTQKAWEELEEVMKEGRISTYAQARNFLSERGIEYASADSVGGLFRRRKVKLKTGRPRHEKADKEEQEEAFKKVRPGGELEEQGAQLLGQAAEDLGLRRSALRVNQLAQEAVLSEGLSPALHGVRRAYEWTYLYAALDPTSGESFCLYLPGMDGLCLETFLERLGQAYADYHLLVVVLDGAPSHTSEQITLPENVSFLRLPAYSPELNPVERWFQEFRGALSNKIFETVELLQEALTKALKPYWQEPVRLRSLAGFSWWVEAKRRGRETRADQKLPVPAASNRRIIARTQGPGWEKGGKKTFRP